MSLIQEALKRKQSEEGGVPLPSSEQLLPPLPAAKYRMRPPVAVVTIRVACYTVLFLGAGAGIFSLIRSFQPPGPASHEAADGGALPELPGEAAVTRVPPDLVESLSEAETEVVEAAPTRKAARTPDRRRVVATAPAGAAGWPQLRVMGVFARPDPLDSSAVIDGVLEEVGTHIEGVEIAEVRQTGVLFRYRGEEKFVRVGRTTWK